MRILVTTFPALGHLHPMMPLILAAQRAGHDVVVATGPDLTGWVGACGLEARAVGVSDDRARSIAAASFPGPFQNSHMFTDVWVSAAMPALVELSSSWMPDLVVHEEADYAGVLMAAALDVPCVTHSWASPARIATDRAHTEKALAPIWERFLPDTAPRRVGQLYLDSCPPPLQTSDLAAIAQQTRVVSIRPGTFDGPPATPPAFLLDLPRPAAYLTLGTVPAFSTPALLAKIAHALAPTFASVVLTSGPNPPESLGPLPRTVHAVRYLSQSLVLPVVDLVVSHAGAGGMVGALMHGLPHLMLPGRAQSQLASSEAVDRLGAGIRLLENERESADISDAASRLYGDPRFAAAAASIRAGLDELPSPAQVLRVVEELAGRRGSRS